MKRLCAATVVLVSSGWMGCGPAHPPDPRGYAGTWERREGPVVSRITLERGDSGFRMRWDLRTDDGTHRVECNRDGVCRETIKDKPYASFRFTTADDAASGHLLVECRGTYDGDAKLELHYVDELVIEDQGRVLHVYTRERAGQRFEGTARPQRWFRRVRG